MNRAIPVVVYEVVSGSKELGGMAQLSWPAQGFDGHEASHDGMVRWCQSYSSPRVKE